MIKKALSFVLALTILSSNLFSQEKDKKEKKVPPLKHEVVVTATRLETPAKEIASSLSVISRDDLERMRKTTVLEALQDVLGVFVIQNGPKGGAASVFLRGANSEHTLVMLDGVELNDPISPSRSFDMAHLLTENIDRIEILRGPQSTLYGSDAMGGVINIITRRGEGKPRFHLSSYSGSYGTFAGTAEISGSEEKIQYSLGVTRFQTNGISAASVSYEGNEEKDGYRNLTLSGRLGYRPLDNLSLDLAVRTIDTETDVDNFGGSNGDDSNNTQDYNALFLRGQVRALLLKNRWEQKLGVSLVDYDRRHENPTDAAHLFDSERGSFKSKLIKIDWQNNFFLYETNTLTFGIDYQQEQGESEYQSESIWGSYSSIFPLRRAQTTGVYLQDKVRLANQFYATAGVRLDIHSKFGTSTTYRLAPAYFIEKTGTKLKATYGTSFKSPSLYQLYAPGTFWGPVGNEDLKPEKSTGWDLGIEQQILGGKALLGATYFSNQYENLINWSVQGFMNIGQAESKGEEFLIQAHPFDNIMFKASYTKNKAKDKDEDTYLLRRPKDKLTVNLNYSSLEKFNINLSLIFIGEREDKDYSNPLSPTQVTLPSYTLFNAAISYDLLQNAQIFCRLDNIFNKEYEMIKGYGAPGLSAYGGVNFLF